MSITRALTHPGHGPSNMQRFKMARAGIAFLVFLVLMVIGLRGRSQATRLMRVQNIALVRDQLRHTLNQEEREPSVGPADESAAPAGLAVPTNSQEKELAVGLKMLVEQFDSEYGSAKLSPAESWDLRLSKAALANYEQRFADALVVIPEDEEPESAKTGDEPARLIRALQVRGDAFYGLHQWEAALDGYQKLLVLRPNHIVTTARIAACLRALGRPEDALAIDHELAALHTSRAHALLLQNEARAAAAQYDNAIRLRFGAQASANADGREFMNELAADYRNLGDALLCDQKPDTAFASYDKAMAIQTRLIKNEVQKGVAEDLAVTRANQGSALLVQGKTDAALEQIEKSIEIQAGFAEQEGRSARSEQLAITRNNRGAVLRFQGKATNALADFDYAVAMLTRIVEDRPQPGPARVHLLSLTNRIRVKLTTVIGFSEKSVDLLTRPFVAGEASVFTFEPEPAVALAISLKNRGYTFLLLGRLDSAIGDLEKAVEIFARLVARPEQNDLVSQFAKSLGSLAWIYATNPNDSLRNADKARTYAFKACELTEWKNYDAVAALAAANANQSNFQDAVKWQQKAIALAPVPKQTELRSRLELYQSGLPYRTSLSKQDSPQPSQR